MVGAYGEIILIGYFFYYLEYLICFKIERMRREMRGEIFFFIINLRVGNLNEDEFGLFVCGCMV